MQGKIIKGIAGFYYVHAENGALYECRARGIFRQQGKKPLVGDCVEIEGIDEEEKTGTVAAIRNRRNVLIRPAAANVDQAAVVFAAASPEPNLNLLDRFLVTMSRQQIPTILCFHKQDLVSARRAEELKAIYAQCGCPVYGTSLKTGEGLDSVRAMLRGKTTVLAGPSGVGKSSLMNWLQPEANMETGAVSEKIRRGRHTTRHAELIHIGDGTYVMDTPGFSSLYLSDMGEEELKDCFAV